MDKKEKNNKHVFLQNTHKSDQRTTRLFKFEVQDQGDSNDENGDDGANNPLVLVHPS